MFRGFTRQEQGSLILLLIVITLGVGLYQYRTSQKEKAIWLEAGAPEEHTSSPTQPGDNQTPSEAAPLLLIDINNASEELLETLPGIDKEEAKRIIHYRTVHGLFGEVAGFRKVEGIDAAVLSSIEHLICVDTTRDLKNEQGKGVQPTGSPPVEKKNLNARINLNTATAEQLKQLRGIGDVLAARIVEYRQKHGPFTHPAQLLRVEGIGQKKYGDNKNTISIR